MGKNMSQDLTALNERHESAKKAILKRLSYQNLTLDDLLAAKAYAEIVKCESNIIASIADAVEHLKR